MSAVKAISYLRDHGVAIELDGDDLLLIGVDGLPDAAVERLRIIKGELIEALRREAERDAILAALDEERRANVERLLDAMAAENERRRDWHAHPVEGWRESRLEWRSAETGEATVIHLSKWRGRP